VVNAVIGKVADRRSLVDSNAVICRGYEYYLVACAERGDTGLPFCRFDRLAGQGENVVHGPSGTRLRLFARGSSNSSFRSTAVVDEWARGSWLGGLLRSVFI
jgi:hypothetical protein